MAKPPPVTADGPGTKISSIAIMSAFIQLPAFRPMPPSRILAILPVGPTR